MTADEAFKTLTENICQQCGYWARCMDECDLRGCDNRDAIKVLMFCCNEKRKTGKWIKDIYGNVVCSECRANRRDHRIGHIAFCNSCGAKMEVEE